MKIEYRGYDISVTKDRSLGGSMMTYYHVYRKADGLCVIEEFTAACDRVSTIAKGMKDRVDEFIQSRGASECLEDCFVTGSWK